MKKILSYIVIAILAMHVTVSFSNAEEEVPLESAPVEQVAPIPEGNTWTSWELMHRTRMLDGFTWIGKVAEYITPKMWGGISNNSSIDTGVVYPLIPTTYDECVQSEMNASFGPNGSMIEPTATAELKNLAKYCATEFYGEYFTGKDYTTREEMTMFLLTALGEKVSLEGEFVDGAFVSNGIETITPFNNVVKTAWYAPFLARATEIELLSSNPPRWSIAREVTDADIMSMLQGYFGTDETDINTLVKMIQAPTSEVVAVNPSTGNSRYPGCDTDDIPVKVGDTTYYWAACNVGASKAGTGVESYGSYFQWGRNIPFSGTGKIETVQGPISISLANTTNKFIVSDDKNWNDWTDFQENNRWGGGINPESITYITASPEDKDRMKGPCELGYHVPTYAEVNLSLLTLVENGQLRSILKSPMSGGIGNGAIYGQELFGSWWLSSSASVGDKSIYGRYISWTDSDNRINMADYRNFGRNIRCIKN